MIFTPGREGPLPYATRFDVTIDPSATAVQRPPARGARISSAHHADRPLLNTNWYRRGGRAGAPMVILLRFNQPVRPADVAPHIAARLQQHDWDVPQLTPEGIERLKTIDPSSVQRFNAKVTAPAAVTKSTAPVGLRLTTEDRSRFRRRAIW